MLFIFLNLGLKMDEEIKLTWKGRLEDLISNLFVGKVIEVISDGDHFRIILKGKNFDSNSIVFFELNSGELECYTYGLSKIKELQHIRVEDILACKGKDIRSIYRPYSPNNSIFATARCNSNCLMCSQPPLDIDDTRSNYLIWDYAIELITDDIKHITITGGEPTLLGVYLVQLINKLLRTFPNLTITVLTNGRTFAKEESIDLMAEIISPRRVILAIPLYSDIYKQHDHIVQAKDAFYQTCLGIQKISSLGFPIEIRIVLHKLSNPRLLNLSKYIHKNFPFVHHVTFMGLEIIGYTKANREELIEDNQEQAIKNLESSLEYLSQWEYNVSIYNTALCHLPESLWKFARKSISDWKNSFPKDCDKCDMKPECSGFFSWNLKYAEVYPISTK